jgi:putative hydrolase of the HAD superfamily
MSGLRPKTKSKVIAVPIKAVTFDVGGTLIEPWPSVGHVYAQVAARNGLKNCAADMLNARFRTAWSSRKPFEHSRAGWKELVDEVFVGLCDPPSQTFFPELYDRFSEPDAWRVFEDVVPTLEALASLGIRLGVISNWDDRLHGLLRAMKLDRHFEMCAISCEIGFSKPSRVIFEQAAFKLGLPANAILHIGDSSEMDVAGARAAGLQAIRIERALKKSGTEAILSLAELPAKIAKL